MDPRSFPQNFHWVFGSWILFQKLLGPGILDLAQKKALDQMDLGSFKKLSWSGLC